MQNTLSYQVHSKEGFYYSIKFIISIIFYIGLFSYLGIGIAGNDMMMVLPVIVYALFFGLILLFRMGIIIGYIKGNAIKISEKQFPEIQEIAEKQSKLLELTKVPDIYVLQAGGLLNAFAARFLGTNYIIIFADILEEAYEENQEAVEFIIGHELGHIKRKHIIKNILLFPSMIVPFLSSAYSRACEYTCDNIGASLSPLGVRNGLILLASGKKLYNKVNFEKFIEQKDTERGFWPWFAEKISSHPKLTKRLAKFGAIEFNAVLKKKNQFKDYSTNDHSKYMPQV
ncbi:MAG: peptidase M48 [Flavobacteriales bacterium]|nr:M48 family metallopeptidase [Bacteroidia bacterium]PCJ77898.1 MAG: peptidase M48 [Flavobacteriales bacterium]